jgi:hypothetical protein
MSFRKNKEKEKREKRVLISGTVMIFITALIGSQLIVEGKMYKEKVSYLDKRGYPINGSLCWDDYEVWTQTEILNQLKGKYNTRQLQSSTWQDWKDQLKSAENAAIYDDSLMGPIYHCNKTYTIWFNTINSRKMDGLGEVTTHFVLPDQVPENSEG